MPERCRIRYAHSAEEVLSELQKCVDYVKSGPVITLLPSCLHDISSRDAGAMATRQEQIARILRNTRPLGTLDGATVEMAEEAGKENLFLFGLTAEEVLSSRGWYNPHWHYEHEAETRAALDLIFSEHFNSHEPGMSCFLIGAALVWLALRSRVLLAANGAGVRLLAVAPS